MVKTNCKCGHEKRDHDLPLTGGMQGYGRCKICLCNRYAKTEAQPLAASANAGAER